MVQHLPAIVAVLTILLLFGTTWVVGRARMKHGIKAPATAGHPSFERAYRVQLNTIESTVMFLPTLWLASTYSAPLWAGLLGLVWIVGRIWYAAGYLKDPARREGGFVLSSAAWLIMLILAIIGLVRVVAVS